MSINKFITKLDLSRQSEIYTGETACYDGGIEVGIPFSGYPSGVDLNNEISSVVIANETATFTGTTATTTFDVYGDWTEPSFSANTSGLTTPITPFSAETQVVGPYLTPTSTTVIDGNTVVLQYSGYSVTYSFENVTEILDTGGTITYSGLTTATLENFVYGSLDYTGSTRYIKVNGTTETERLIISSGATIGYTWTCVDSEGLGEWLPNSSADTNTYVTGGTLDGSYNLNLDWNTGGSASPISLSGLVDTFTGNTSGDCINDIYVKNIHSCSPLFINPLDEGNVYFGSTSAVTIDVSGEIIVQNNIGRFNTDFDTTNLSQTLLSGNTTSLIRHEVSDGAGTGVQLGVRAISEGSLSGFGSQGDGFVYAGTSTNGLNIINQLGAGKEDYIRFYAGQDANGTTPDIHIQGSGATRGYVGFNTEIPRKNVDIIGDGILSGELTIETINTGTSVYLLAATSGGTIIQGNDLYSDICSFCSSEVSGDTIICTGATEVSTINADTGEIGCTSVYGCTQWCAYETNGTLVNTTTDYETANKYKLSGYITKCCDAGSEDGGTDYGTSISASTTTSGDTPPAVITGLTRPFVVRKVMKVGFLNTHNSDIFNSNQSSISNSTLGKIELSTLSSIESSFNSSLYSSYLSGIIASENGFISNSGNATIIGSQYSTLSGVTGSTIIGGNNITGTENDTVYVPNLEINDRVQVFGSSATGINSHAEGSNTIASGPWSHAEGGSTSAIATYSHAEGFNTSAASVYSHAEGANTTASGNGSHAEGSNTTASGDYSHAEGRDTTASGDYSHAEGFSTSATTFYSHAEGQDTIASGVGSHAEGYQTSATTSYAHAEGSNTLASGANSHAEGSGTVASGQHSHAEGQAAVASGQTSHAEGQTTVASGSFSHSEGFETLASGNGSHAEGYQTTASGIGAHAEGGGTVASGNYSHAAGSNSIASGTTSFIHSTNSVVTGDRSVVLGGQNITGTTNDTVYVPKLNIDTLGGGTSINNLGIDVNGNVVVGTAGGGAPEATTATTTTINFTGQTIYYNAGSPGTGDISEDLTGAKLGLIQKIYHNDGTEPTYPAGWVLMGDAIYFTSTLNIIYAEWAGGSRVEYWYVQEQ